MANTQYASMKHSGPQSLTGLLSASLIGALLIISVPALADRRLTT